MDESGPIVNLLWTGGWDSTFRLLTLLSDHRCRVQPYYVVDRDRPSWPIETERIRHLTACCRRKRHRGTLLDPILVEKAHIPPDPQISLLYRKLASANHLGAQYEWLAWFANQHELDDLEIGVVRDRLMDRLLRNEVTWEASPLKRYVLRPAANPGLAFLRYFRFPLLDTTKREMQRHAVERGWIEILDLTWFCFRPLANRWPCGMCMPCRITIDEGMGRRVGWRGLICHYAVAPVGRLLPDPVFQFSKQRFAHFVGRP